MLKEECKDAEWISEEEISTLESFVADGNANEFTLSINKIRTSSVVDGVSTELTYITLTNQFEGSKEWMTISFEFGGTDIEAFEQVLSENEDIQMVIGAIMDLSSIDKCDLFVGGFPTFVKNWIEEARSEFYYK